MRRLEQAVGAAMRHCDLSRRAPTAGARQMMHVSNASQKSTLRSMLLDNSLGLSAELQRLRERLGYARAPEGGGGAPATSEGGPEGGRLSSDEALAARRRRWMLASMAREWPEAAWSAVAARVSAKHAKHEAKRP